VCCRYGVFKVRAGRPAIREQPAVSGRSLKTQQRGHVEVDVVPGESRSRTAEAIDELDACRSKSSCIP
jgi:hypothetical protein